MRSMVLALALALLTWWAAPAQAEEAARRPNVLVILADDQGYADLGVQGCKDVPTPNIDSLARNGIRCTSGYVSGEENGTGPILAKQAIWVRLSLSGQGSSARQRITRARKDEDAKWE